MAPGRGKKATSNYHSPLRAKQAAATRRAIVDAALTRFVERGWSATSLPSIAAEAGVSVDTIYATFGTKSALLLEVVEVAIVGDDGDAAMAERADFARLGQGRRPERLRAGVRYTMDVYERSVPVLRTLREAAASDTAAAERLARYDQDRHDLIAAGMALILGQDPPADVVDGVWALISPEVYEYLVNGRGWDDARVEDWFVDLAKAVIARA